MLVALRDREVQGVPCVRSWCETLCVTVGTRMPCGLRAISTCSTKISRDSGSRTTSKRPDTLCPGAAYFFSVVAIVPRFPLTPVLSAQCSSCRARFGVVLRFSSSFPFSGRYKFMDCFCCHAFIALEQLFACWRPAAPGRWCCVVLVCPSGVVVWLRL